MSNRIACQKYATTHRVIPAGKEIYAEGEICDDLYIIDDGWAIQHQILEDGRRQILNFALPGSILGFQPDPDTPISHSAESLTDVFVTVIPKSRLPEIFRRDADLALQLVVCAMEVINTAFDSLTDIGRRTAKEAVAHLLMRLYQKAGKTHVASEARSAVFPLTLEHIGDALGLTGVHVCRTLKVLREEGIAKFTRGRLEILDPEGLADAAGAVSDEVPVHSGRPLQPCGATGVRPVPAMARMVSANRQLAFAR